jgi:hypothetical protein
LCSGNELEFGQIAICSISENRDAGNGGTSVKPNDVKNQLPHLKKGSRGPEVALLQRLLQRKGLLLAKGPARTMAVFDETIHQAVLRFQRENQLMTDGIVGPQTWSALDHVVPAIPEPQANGTVTPYSAVIRVKLKTEPRIYYVNGMQTDGKTHAHTSYALSALTNRVVYGVFNATWSKTIPGFGVDFVQCISDWAFGVTSKLIELRDVTLIGIAKRIREWLSNRPSKEADQLIARAIEGLSPVQRWQFCETMFFFNRATRALYKELSGNIGPEQIIIAHSQGNLITANALWAITIMHGGQLLDSMRVYSLASPTPAWPLGIRRRLRTYHHDDDIVTWANPHNWLFLVGYSRAIGDYDHYGGVPGLKGHLLHNFAERSFAGDIRKYLKLTAIEGWAFPKSQ